MSDQLSVEDQAERVAYAIACLMRMIALPGTREHIREEWEKQVKRELVELIRISKEPT